ncbi:MAG TPA: hypothetical protein VGM88_14000 [Kofleriaceae bacterium]
MTCARCEATEGVGKTGWCVDCERTYDQWSRAHAADIVPAVLVGLAFILTGAMGLPLLGLPWILSLASIFCGFGGLYATHRLIRRYRRKQFAEILPRASLVEKT